MGFLAAAFWFGSTVVKVNHERFEAGLRARGQTWMPAAIVEDDGSNVTETIKLQSRWNRWAAVATANAWPEA